MSALAHIELDYQWDKGEEVDLEAVRTKFPKFFDKEGKPKTTWDLQNLIVCSKELETLSELGIVYKVKRFKGLIPATIGSGINTPEGSVHIHLPNYVLGSFNKVCKLEDCCTDELQEHLNDGWRIIAVCPPLNARRPDYILAKVV